MSGFPIVTTLPLTVTLLIHIRIDVLTYGRIDVWTYGRMDGIAMIVSVHERRLDLHSDSDSNSLSSLDSLHLPIFEHSPACGAFVKCLRSQ